MHRPGQSCWPGDFGEEIQLFRIDLFVFGSLHHCVQDSVSCSAFLWHRPPLRDVRRGTPRVQAASVLGPLGGRQATSACDNARVVGTGGGLTGSGDAGGGQRPSHRLRALPDLSVVSRENLKNDWTRACARLPRPRFCGLWPMGRAGSSQTVREDGHPSAESARLVWSDELSGESGFARHRFPCACDTAQVWGGRVPARRRCWQLGASVTRALSRRPHRPAAGACRIAPCLSRVALT